MSRERWVVLAAALMVTLLTARLGWWQLDRAAQKRALHAAVAERRALPPLAAAELARDAPAVADQLHRAIELRGRWIATATVLLDNRQLHGVPGFFVITPLRLADGSAVLVQRGWLPRDPRDRTRVEVPALPDGEATVVGRIAAPPARLFEPAPGASGPIRQNLDPGSYGREIGVTLRPLSVLQTDPGGARADGLHRQWPVPAPELHKHYGYAVQWFALSALVAGLYVWFQLVRPRRSRDR